MAQDRPKIRKQRQKTVSYSILKRFRFRGTNKMESLIAGCKPYYRANVDSHTSDLRCLSLFVFNGDIFPFNSLLMFDHFVASTLRLRCVHSYWPLVRTFICLCPSRRLRRCRRLRRLDSRAYNALTLTLTYQKHSLGQVESLCQVNLRLDQPVV